MMLICGMQTTPTVCVDAWATLLECSGFVEEQVIVESDLKDSFTCISPMVSNETAITDITVRLVGGSNVRILNVFVFFFKRSITSPTCDIGSADRLGIH